LCEDIFQAPGENALSTIEMPLLTLLLTLSLGMADFLSFSTDFLGIITWCTQPHVRDIVRPET
jgi:hypothetical protein